MTILKLKHPLLCRIATYVMILGVFIIPMVAVICIAVIPESVKAVVSVACCTGLLIYLFRNFPLLMCLDIFLGTLQGYKGACKQYPLKTDMKAIEKRLMRFGTNCEPILYQPQPQILRYKSTAPITIYSSGIEKIVAVYHCAFLTKTHYHAIINSALANSQALINKKKHLFLDKEQKSAPLNRATVILILATAVEPTLSQGLYELICKKEGDCFDQAVLPCVVDLSSKTCVFNSPRLAYTGTQYPVKNRGIRLIKKYIFGGKLPEGTGKLLEEVEDFDPEMTLWQFWRDLKREWSDQERNTKKYLSKMSHGEVLIDDDQLLLKWEDRGAAWSIRTKENDNVEVVVCDTWDYPKVRPMSQKHIALLKDLVRDRFAQEDSSVRFVTVEEDE